MAGALHGADFGLGDLVEFRVAFYDIVNKRHGKIQVLRGRVIKEEIFTVSIRGLNGVVHLISRCNVSLVRPGT